MNCTVLNARGNIPVDFDIFLETLKDRDVIYVGEFHQIPEVLSFQMDMVSGLILKGIQPTLGLEMFNVLQQKILDYYTAGVIQFEQLLSLYEIGSEGFDLNHYINLIEIAVKNRLKVIALNIPRNIASAVAKHGLDRQELKGFHLNEQEIKNCSKGYKEALSSFYRKHPHEEITEENFILAQAIKDEMMAETIVRYLTTGILRNDTKGNENNPPSPPFSKGGMGGFSGENIGMPLIVIAGRGHIEYGLGIPERVKQKLNKRGKSASDVSIATAYDGEHFKQGIADYIVLI